METAQAFDPDETAASTEDTDVEPLRLLHLAHVDPETWFRDLWAYIELEERDLG